MHSQKHPGGQRRVAERPPRLTSHATLFMHMRDMAIIASMPIHTTRAPRGLKYADRTSCQAHTHICALVREILT